MIFLAWFKLFKYLSVFKKFSHLSALITTVSNLTRPFLVLHSIVRLEAMRC